MALRSGHVFCVLNQHSLLCYTNISEQLFEFNSESDMDSLVDEVLSLFHIWQAYYVTLIIDSSDETLLYEQTPRLYPWEIEQYAQRQSNKRFAMGGGLIGYRYISLRSKMTFPASYLLVLFSVPESAILYRLILKLSQHPKLWLISVRSLTLLIGDYAVSQQVSKSHVSWINKVLGQSFSGLFSSYESQVGRLWVCRWQEDEVKQLLCYRGLVVIQRTITLISGSDMDIQHQLDEENLLLMRFLQTQTANQVSSLLIKSQVSYLFTISDRLLPNPEPRVILLRWLWFNMNFNSDYQLSRVKSWVNLRYWANAMMIIGVILFMGGIFASGVFQWQNHLLQAQLSDVLLAQSNLDSELSILDHDADQNEMIDQNDQHNHHRDDNEPNTLGLSNLSITPELLRARVNWMQEWHILKMCLDPSDVLSDIAHVIVQFPAIELSALAFHNGPPASDSAELLDAQQSTLRITANIDARRFESLPDEETAIQLFLAMLSHIYGVNRVELVLNPIITLKDQPMTVMFAPERSDAVLHSLVIVLHLNKILIAS